MLCLEPDATIENHNLPGMLIPDYERLLRLSDPVSYRLHEPNAMLLDYPRWHVDDQEVQPSTEILTLDDKLRDEMGLSRRRGGTVEQTWMLPNKSPSHLLMLYYEFNSEIETDALLAIEHPEDCRITLNGEAVINATVGYYVDEFIKTVRLPLLRAGQNELTVEMPFCPRTNLEALYILGDFSVELNGRRMTICEKQKNITCGDITRQGMPMYTGALDYLFEYEAREAGQYYIHVPRYEAAVLGIYVNGIQTGTIAFAPHRAPLGMMNIGKHEIMVRVYCTHFNAFGNLHNANDETVWHGYHAYRTRDDDWSDSYCNLRPAGLISGIEIELVANSLEYYKNL